MMALASGRIPGGSDAWGAERCHTMTVAGPAPLLHAGAALTFRTELGEVALVPELAAFSS